jgi:predicted phage terminase large subunit-like protein
MNITPDVIYGFVQSLLLTQFDEPVKTPEFHRELWELFCSDRKKVAIAAPRGHAKSTAITHSAVLAAVLFREKKYVIIASDTVGQAIQFLGDIKKELLDNDKLIAAFGIKTLVKDREDDIVVRFSDGAEFRIQAKGAEQKMRGLKWHGRRPDLIIGDDLENDEIVLNEERREKFRRWFFNALVPCLSKSGHIRVVGTILHLDSLLERLMPPIESEDTVWEEVKSYYVADDREWLSIRYKAHNEDFSTILWEEQWPRERLESVRRDYIEQGFPDGYAQEYLNYPIDEENAFFRRSDFREATTEGDQHMQYYAAADLAISEKDSRAYSVIAVAGLNSEGILKLVDIIRFRGDSLEIIDQMFAVQRVYSPEIFVVEEENIAKSIGPFLYTRMHESGVYMNLEKMKPHGTDKIRRARAIQARMRAGGCTFDKKAAWYPAFETEMLQFPKGKYVDQVDAYAWIGLVLDKMTTVPTPQERADARWEEEYLESVDEEEHGLCTTTGY